MEKRLVFLAFLGFVVLSLFGVILRLMAVSSLPDLNYSFLLHAHSHFAFSGWIFFSMALLIIKVVSPDQLKTYRPFFIVTLVCAFGMLIGFSIQGYKAVPLAFSTLFVFITYYFTYKILRDKNFKVKLHPLSHLLIKSALIFLCLSSLGPFALGPLSALGLKRSPLHMDAIHFYLHFQLNGWMLFSALGLISNSYLTKSNVYPRREVMCFIFSSIPLFFIFTLWSAPPLIVWIIALVASVLNFVSWVRIITHVARQRVEIPFLVKVALIAISLKVFFQMFICFPVVGTWAFGNRNLIIGYIHLLTLGTIMPMILQQFVHSGLVRNTESYRKINILFIVAVCGYLACLFLQPVLAIFNTPIPYLQVILLGVALAFLLLGIAYLFLVGSVKADGNVERRYPPRFSDTGR